MAARVLIVDDSLLAEHALRNYFIRLGHEVVGMAKNAKDGRKMFSNLKPDLVTVDAVMPGESGQDFIAHLNQLEQEKNVKTKILMISSDEITSEDKSRLRVDKYIRKPVTLNKIKEALAELRIT